MAEFFDFFEEASQVIKDEYKEYCKQRVQPYDNLLEWWGARQQKFPYLSKMAFDLLSIPLMFVECERVFSSAKLFITERRSRLKNDIVEACTCLRAWYKEELESSMAFGSSIDD